jgi:TatA/E family protein of Tat protein translocase
MYLFIFESIGTSELILIALVALIFFGPRKLPELARSLGKAMNEFRRSTNEFKQVWEKEVASEVNQIKDDVNFTSFTEDSKNGENTIARKNEIAAPEIKEVSQESFQGVISQENLPTEKEIEPEDALASKQNWL